MLRSKIVRIAIPLTLIFLGLWLALSAGSPAPEAASRQSAILALAPGGSAAAGSAVQSQTDTGPATPFSVDMSAVRPGVHDRNSQFDRWQRGELDMDEVEGMRGAAEMAERRARSARLLPSNGIQVADSSISLATTAAAGAGFDSLDYTECCGGGGNVPPDPELAVGPNHVIAVVNVAFEIYDKNGTSLKAPTTFDSFMASNPSCNGVFDPNALYDESADRYILGIDADGSAYCLAVSQTGDPLGSWNIYAFSTGKDFFDYPHAGVGQDAIYMGANMFRCRGPFGCTFAEARIWAFDKSAMYAGQAANYVTVSLGNNDDTPQPLNLHGWSQGTWPSGGPHYILTETGYNGADYTVYSWSDPFGANVVSTVGTADLAAATGVSAGMPVDVPQLDGQTLQANDFRPQDFEYRNGYGWTATTIACNPGSGTVNCVRWAQIDLTDASVVDAGVFASSGEYRTFADLAVNHCGDMYVGYTKSSSSMYPGIYVNGREAGDPAGTLQTESLLKAGEIAYTSFEASAPRRWGDYTEMTIAPDGLTFWYLGEYSKDTGTTNGRWGTYIGSFSFPGCGVGPVDNAPVTSITSPADGASVAGTINIAADASDDNGVVQVEFFVDGSSIGVDSDGSNGYAAAWDSTTTADGSHTFSATATDTAGKTGSDSITVVVDNVADVTIHAGDLDASTAAARGGKWNATVSITIHDAGEAPASGITVTGVWSGGASGQGSCITDGSGICSITYNNVRRNASSVTFTVDSAVGAGFVYHSSSNHDPDGDSDGTAIVVAAP